MEDNWRGIKEISGLKAEVMQGVKSDWGRGHRLEGCNSPVKQDWILLLLKAAHDGKEFNKAVFKILKFSLKLSIGPKDKQ